MKPKIFIGSSKEAVDLAEAIHVGLCDYAECTPWHAGVFGISEATFASLRLQLAESDFAAFVFAPDDLLQIHGDLLAAARDNVIYEAGLFSGRLGFERCFIAVPDAPQIRVPSDLAGLTLARYEAARTDKNLRAAVLPVCRSIKDKIKILGIHPEHFLNRLISQFQAAELTIDVRQRVTAKSQIYDQMYEFCRTHPIDKRALVGQHRIGAYVVLAAAIILKPESSDVTELLQIKSEIVTRGTAQHKLADAVTALREHNKINPEQIRELRDFLLALPSPEPTFRERVERL